MRYLFILLISGQLMGQGYETQSYALLGVLGAVEIRHYPACIQVTTQSQKGTNNFSKLFRYISKGNQSQTKIAMTTPVYRQSENGKSTMAFVLPQKYLSEKPPQPLTPDVKIQAVAAGYFAALRFGGYANTSKLAIHERRLLEVLDQAEIQIQSELMILGYNSPFYFINRRNEVMFAIDQASLPDSLTLKAD